MHSQRGIARSHQKGWQSYTYSSNAAKIRIRSKANHAANHSPSQNHINHSQIFLLFDGGTVQSPVHRDSKPLLAAKKTVMDLLNEY
jgi:hypothetical protein